jgi:hypothetical protein
VNANCCVSLIGGNALASLGLSIAKNRIDGFTVLWGSTLNAPLAGAG